MKTVFLIGNGFDKAQGLKTGYNDFRDYYKGLDKVNQEQSVLDFITRVEKEESADKKWADLEVALGRHTDIFVGDNAVEDAISFHDKLSAAIFDYIKIQGAELKISESVYSSFLKCFFAPSGDGRFTPDETNKLENFYSQWQNINPWDVKLITFNYTDSIQKCTNYKSRTIDLGKNRYSRSVHFTNIEHIHGYHDNRQIIGVNDESQIVNKALHGTEAMDWYIKSRLNTTNGMGCEQKCRNWINGADLICVFGMALGETDKLWWAAIVSRLLKQSNSRLLFFTFDEINKFNNNQSAHKNRFKISEKRRFLEASGLKLSESQISTLMNQITVGYNTNLFKCAASAK